MIVTQGGRFGGYGFYVPKDKPVFLWNLVDLKRVRLSQFIGDHLVADHQWPP